MTRRRPWRLASALMLSLGLLVLLASAAAGTVVDSLVRSTLIRESMHELVATATSAGTLLTREQQTRRHASLSEDLADLASGGTYVMLTSQSGRFQLSKGPPPPTGPAGGWLSGPATGWFRYQEIPYAYARSSLTIDRQPWDLVVVRSEPQQAQLIAALGRILLVAEALFIGTLMIGILVVVRQITDPLSALRRFAERVHTMPSPFARLPAAPSFREVEALTTAFNQMLDRLEAAQTREREFASDAAHALRTPVQVIRGYLATLSRWGQSDPQVRAQALAALTREAASMDVLIHRLLELARLETDSPAAQLSVLDLHHWLDDLLPDLEDTASHHPLELTLPQTARIWADSDLLAAVLRILVENADAYADEMGTVTIAVDVHGPLTTLYVKNPGPPIPDSTLPYLFQRFYRGNPRDGAASHYGLGLALADQMVQVMHGKWHVTSTDGQVGFGVILPTASDDRPPASALDGHSH